MKKFVFLIRTNPDYLTPDFVNEMCKRWQSLINGWTEQSLLVSGMIFREAGTVLSAGGKREQTYLREHDHQPPHQASL